MSEEKTLTGYPSIDKPWMKYYSDEERLYTIPDGSMFDYMYERNVDYPNDIAMEYYGHNYSYQELFCQIDKCCRNLAALGIQKGDIVTIQAISLPQVVVLIYALNRIGACGNMLYPDAKSEDVIASMNKTDSRLLIVLDKLFSTYEQDLPDSFNHTIILLNIADQMSFFPRLIARKKAAYSKKNFKLHTISWKKFINGRGVDYQECHDGTIPAFMLRTGGTTGIPKETVLDSRGFNSVAKSTFYHDISDVIKRQEGTLLLLPPFIAFGIGTGIHQPLAAGTKLVIALDVSPTAVSGLVKKYKPRYLSAGVVQMEQLVNDLERENIDLSYLQLLWLGGESMNQGFEEKLIAFLRDHGSSALPLNGYGLTETSAAVTVETMDVHQLGSAGTPLALCNMKIVDSDTGEELTYNKLGEIYLSSPSIMHGYYKNQQATDEVIETINGERWLHTGDIGFISEDGLLTVTGRIKRIIVCKEGIVYHKVFPLVIEDQLGKIPGVKEITIVGRPDEVSGNVLVAYVVADTQSSFEIVEKTLRDYCISNLESFEQPVEYVAMDTFPRTLIGKVDYRTLEEMAKKIG